MIEEQRLLGKEKAVDWTLAKILSWDLKEGWDFENFNEEK